MFGGGLGTACGCSGCGVRTGNPCSVALEEGSPTCLQVVGEGLSGQFLFLLWRVHLSVFSTACCPLLLPCLKGNHTGSGFVIVLTELVSEIHLQRIQRKAISCPAPQHTVYD